MGTGLAWLVENLDTTGRAGHNRPLGLLAPGCGVLIEDSQTGRLDFRESTSSTPRDEGRQHVAALQMEVEKLLEDYDNLSYPEFERPALLIGSWYLRLLDDMELARRGNQSYPRSNTGGDPLAIRTLQELLALLVKRLAWEW